MNTYKEEVADAINYVKYLQFDKKHPWHRNLVALYCSLIEYSDSLIFLSENEKNIGIPVIFRGLLEAYVDFKNLSEEKEYGNHMEASHAKESLKVIEEANQNQNGFLASIAKDPLLNKQIQDYKNKLGDLKPVGWGELANPNMTLAVVPQLIV